MMDLIHAQLIQHVGKWVTLVGPFREKILASTSMEGTNALGGGIQCGSIMSSALAKKVDSRIVFTYHGDGTIATTMKTLLLSVILVQSGGSNGVSMMRQRLSNYNQV